MCCSYHTRNAFENISVISLRSRSRVGESMKDTVVHCRMTPGEIRQLDNLVSNEEFRSRSDAIRSVLKEHLLRAKIERERPLPPGAGAE